MTADQPVRVVRGDPTDEEVAAVVVVLHLLRARARVRATRAAPAALPAPAGWAPSRPPAPWPGLPAR